MNSIEILAMQLGILITQLIFLAIQVTIHLQEVKHQRRTTENKVIDTCEKYKLDVMNLLIYYNSFIFSDKDSNDGKFNTDEIKRKLKYLKSNKLTFNNVNDINKVLNTLNELNNEIERNKNYKKFKENNNTKIEDLKNLLRKIINQNKIIYIKSDGQNINETLQEISKKINSIDVISQNISDINTNISSIKNNFINKTPIK